MLMMSPIHLIWNQIPNFNEIFNELFEKYKLNDSGADAGYGDWLKSDEDIDLRSSTLAGMNESFQEKKREVRALDSLTHSHH